MRPCELRPDAHPVDRGSAQPVDHEERRPGAAEVEVVDRAFDVGDFMPHCVKGCYARMAPPRRSKISATAAGGRRPSLCRPSKTGNELRAAITSSASLIEH